MRKPVSTRLGIVLFGLLASTAAAQTVAITGGTVALGDGSAPIEGGTVVIRDGRIAAAGAGVAVPADAPIVAATGTWVAPGLVAGFSRVRLAEVDAVDPTHDTQDQIGSDTGRESVCPYVYNPVVAVSLKTK